MKNLFICGFSRGAIACSYIGLADDEIASHTNSFGSKQGTCQVLAYSHSRRMLLSGGGDGYAMVRCISSGEGGKALGEAGTGPGLPALAPFFANVNLVDPSGSDDTVTGVCASFDDKYLLTVGSRGGFFSLRLRYAELEKAAQQAADGRAKELAAKAAKSGGTAKKGAAKKGTAKKKAAAKKGAAKKAAKKKAAS